MLYTPAPWNTAIIDHQLDVKRGASWAGMGTGKTGSTLTAMQIVQDLLDRRPYLVIAPKRVASRTWPREALKWDHIDGDTAAIVGTAQERAAILRGGLRSGNVARFTISYDNLPWLINFLSDAKMPWPFRTVVADESTKLKSMRLRQGGKRAGELRDLILSGVRIDRFIELTGTPAPNGYGDLWAQIWFLDQGRRLGKSYTAYQERWFTPGRIAFAKWSLRDGAAEEIDDRLKDICLSVSVPVEKPIVNQIMIELPNKVRDMYRRMERERLLEIKGQEISASIAAAKMGKLLQICAGAIYDEDGRAHHLHDAKIEALQSVINEAGGMPVLVAINFKFEAPMIIKAFPGARLLDTDKDIDDFAAGRVPVGIAHPAMLGHGINDMEHGTNIGVFYSGDWNLEMHDQIIERIGPMRQKQSGYDRPVFLHYLMIEDSVDEAVFDRRVGKMTVQDSLKKAMERVGL